MKDELKWYGYGCKEYLDGAKMEGLIHTGDPSRYWERLLAYCDEPFYVEVTRLRQIADAAAAWAAAVAEPNGVDDAEKALIAAVKAWQGQQL